MSRIGLIARVSLGLAVLAMLLARYQPLFRLIPQPLQDRLWRAAPEASGIVVVMMLAFVIGIPPASVRQGTDHEG